MADTRVIQLIVPGQQIDAVYRMDDGSLSRERIQFIALIDMLDEKTGKWEGSDFELWNMENSGECYEARDSMNFLGLEFAGEQLNWEGAKTREEKDARWKKETE